MIYKLLRRARAFWWRAEELARLRASLFEVAIANGQLNLGKEIFFHVPVRIDGLGKVTIGDSNHFGFRQAPRLGNGEIMLQARAPEAAILIGQGNWFSNNVTVIACAKVTIGSDCLIGDGVTIFDSDFHGLNPKKRSECGLVAPINIGDNVWIGSRAIILKGVVIGSGSVIAPMSVVTKEVTANSLVAGSPARLIRYLE